MFGLRSASNDLPVKKPWTSATSSHVVCNYFDNKLCAGHISHQACEGKDTKLSENYTSHMVFTIHTSHMHHLKIHNKSMSEVHRKLKTVIDDECMVAAQLPNPNCPEEDLTVVPCLYCC
jgi:hypothetical protein